MSPRRITSVSAAFVLLLFLPATAPGQVPPSGALPDEEVPEELSNAAPDEPAPEPAAKQTTPEPARAGAASPPSAPAKADNASAKVKTEERGEAPAKKDSARMIPITDAMLTLLKGFRFGSYGRIGVSGDLARSSKAKHLNVVTHGPRLEESPYVELDLGYVMDRGDDLGFRVAFTLAFSENFFHYNGEWDADIAVRNLYLEAINVFTPALSIWAGSRMYRGDDIYLFDYWPLDMLNTLGAGAKLRLGKTSINFHGGVNRLDDAFQYQKYPVPGAPFGSEEVEVLDRQRAVFSLKATHEMPGLTEALSLKVAAYGELHHLPEGTLRKDLETKDLPSDLGWVAGFQLGFWGFGDNAHLNIWGRAAGGLAAYGELAVPGSLDLEKKAEDAREYVVALSGNFERGIFGLMLGAYMRYFEDADGNKSDYDDGWEYVVAARPIFFIHRHFHQAAEISWQGRRPNGLNPRTQTHLVPNVMKFSLIPTLSWDRGSYSRPHIRFIYTLTYLDEAARILFPKEDPRYGESMHHFMGVQVEWWFNSSYR